jgi:hypothetical protein
LGSNSPIKGKSSTPTRIPAEIFRDVRKKGGLYVIFKTLLGHEGTNWRELFPAKGAGTDHLEEQMHMFKTITKALLLSGHLIWPTLYFESSVPKSARKELSKIAKDHSASVVDTSEEASHVVIWDAVADGNKNLYHDHVRTVANRSTSKGQEQALAHWWYFPDSHDVWVPAAGMGPMDDSASKDTSSSLADKERDGKDAPRPQLRVCCRFVKDVKKFNEWGNPNDYEVDAVPEVIAMKGAMEGAVPCLLSKRGKKGSSSSDKRGGTVVDIKSAAVVDAEEKTSLPSPNTRRSVRGGDDISIALSIAPPKSAMVSSRGGTGPRGKEDTEGSIPDSLLTGSEQVSVDATDAVLAMVKRPSLEVIGGTALRYARLLPVGTSATLCKTWRDKDATSGPGGKRKRVETSPNNAAAAAATVPEEAATEETTKDLAATTDTDMGAGDDDKGAGDDTDTAKGDADMDTTVASKAEEATPAEETPVDKSAEETESTGAKSEGTPPKEMAGTQGDAAEEPKEKEKADDDNDDDDMDIAQAFAAHVKRVQKLHFCDWFKGHAVSDVEKRLLVASFVTQPLIGVNPEVVVQSPKKKSRSSSRDSKSGSNNAARPQPLNSRTYLSARNWIIAAYIRHGKTYLSGSQCVQFLCRPNGPEGVEMTLVFPTCPYKQRPQAVHPRNSTIHIHTHARTQCMYHNDDIGRREK